MTDDDLAILDARMDHAEILFAWRNDPETVRMSGSREVSWGEHVYWLYWKIRKMKEDSHHFQICMMKVIGDGGSHVGTFRVEDGVLSYTIAPEFRGQGLGTIMLKRIRRMYGRLICKIRLENVASIRAASNAGHIVILIE